MRKPEMILIDVDGTLVDSVPDLACSPGAWCARSRAADEASMPVRVLGHTE